MDCCKTVPFFDAKKAGFFPWAAHGKIGAWEGTRRGTENAEGLEENRN